MNSLAASSYHSLLRISALVCAVVICFDGGLVSKITAQMSEEAGYFVANSVGVSVGVAPNEYNQITAALTAKENQLNIREDQIYEREIAVGLRSTDGSKAFDRSTFVLSTILFIILVLIVLNYILDFLRYKERKAQQLTV